jgi:hypothetical protein
MVQRQQSLMEQLSLKGIVQQILAGVKIKLKRSLINYIVTPFWILKDNISRGAYNLFPHLKTKFINFDRTYYVAF